MSVGPVSSRHCGPPPTPVEDEDVAVELTELELTLDDVLVAASDDALEDAAPPAPDSSPQAAQRKSRNETLEEVRCDTRVSLCNPDTNFNETTVLM